MCLSSLNSLASAAGGHVTQVPNSKTYVIVIGDFSVSGSEQYIRGVLAGFFAGKEAARVL